MMDLAVEVDKMPHGVCPVDDGVQDPAGFIQMQTLPGAWRTCVSASV